MRPATSVALFDAPLASWSGAVYSGHMAGSLLMLAMLLGPLLYKFCSKRTCAPMTPTSHRGPLWREGIQSRQAKKDMATGTNLRQAHQGESQCIPLNSLLQDKNPEPISLGSFIKKKEKEA